MSKLRLVVVRHGETPANLTGVVTGRSDDILTENGKAQMLKIRQELADYNFRAVYASPMKRCVESAQLVAPAYEPIYDDRLAERDLGELKNYNISELWQKPLWNSLEIPRLEGNAETLLSGLNRVHDFLDDLKKTHPDGGDILLITHSFISHCLWIITENIKDEKEMSSFLHPNSEIRIYNY